MELDKEKIIDDMVYKLDKWMNVSFLANGEIMNEFRKLAKGEPELEYKIIQEWFTEAHIRVFEHNIQCFKVYLNQCVDYEKWSKHKAKQDAITEIKENETFEKVFQID